MADIAYFKYIETLYNPNSNGFRVAGAVYSPGLYKVTDISDGPNDSLIQFGDITNDHIDLTLKSGTDIGLVSYVGKTNDNQGVLIRLDGYSGQYKYRLLTNQFVARNSYLNESNAPFTVCYVAGTLIRTVKGDVAIEQLAVGDVVVTASGAERPIKWLGHRAYSGRLARSNPDLLPVCVKAGALADGVPARDLWVSSKHAMVIDGVLVPAEHLVNGVTIVRAERVETVEYWHVELGSHDVLLAEGAPSESFVDDNGRGIFHNAHTFHAMYPDEKRVEAIYCAPRVEDGYVLDAIRRRFAERAGLAVPPMLALGALRGALDVCDGTMIQGWAQDLAYPDAPVCLDVLVDGARVAIVYAEHLRRDLRQAGIGDGYHAFSLRLAAPLSRDMAHKVEVKRSADGMIVGAATLEALHTAVAT